MSNQIESPKGWFVKSLVTDGWLVEDINVRVFTDRAVWVTADQHNSSTDLHRALSQRLIYKFALSDLDQMTVPLIQQSSAELQEAKDEVVRLARENDILRAEIAGLKIALSSLSRGPVAAPVPVAVTQQPLSMSAESMDALAARILAKVHMISPSGTTGYAPAPLAATHQQDVPMFIPDSFGADKAAVQIQVETQKADGSAVQSAGNKLKDLLRKKGV